MPPTGMPGAPKPRGPFVPIPLKYKDASTSGLTYTVTSAGRQEHNIDLQP
jgi:hypothetical protein